MNCFLNSGIFVIWWKIKSDFFKPEILVILLLLRFVLVSFCQRWYKPRHFWEGKNLNWGTACVRLACGQVCGGIILISDWWGRVQITAGNAVPDQGGPGAYKRAGWATMENEPGSNIPPWYQFLPWGLTLLFMIECELKSALSSPSCFWSWCLAQQ